MSLAIFGLSIQTSNWTLSITMDFIASLLAQNIEKIWYYDKILYPFVCIVYGKSDPLRTIVVTSFLTESIFFLSIECGSNLRNSILSRRPLIDVFIVPFFFSLDASSLTLKFAWAWIKVAERKNRRNVCNLVTIDSKLINMSQTRS